MIRNFAFKNPFLQTKNLVATQKQYKSDKRNKKRAQKVEQVEEVNAVEQNIPEPEIFVQKTEEQPVQKVQTQQQTQRSGESVQDQLNKMTSKSVPEYSTPDYSKFANLEYKQYPEHLTHFDKSHKNYIYSERDMYNEKEVREEHNKWIDTLKRDIATQKKVHEILTKMDRPYLRGLPGTTRNISGGVQDYFKPTQVQAGLSPELKANQMLELNFRNENRWTDQDVFTPNFAKMTHYDVNWKKEIEERPVNKNFHPDKGYKYDVETPYEQRYAYQADRLGHPEILGNPFERLMRLEGEMFHPQYLDQPFVQMPNTSPDPSLNFEPGQVVYENTKLLEWAKFWKLGGLVGLAWSAMFVPYQLLFKTHMPLEHAHDNLFIPYHQTSMFFWDNNALHIPVAAGSIAYVLYVATSYAHRISNDYVVRAQYSKDKELLFVTKISPYGSTSEHVYETHQLEILPPSVKSAVQDMSIQDSNGLIDCTDMTTQTSLVFYGDNRYWNTALKSDFVAQVSNLWTKDYVGYNRQEKVQQQIAESINIGTEGNRQLE